MSRWGSVVLTLAVFLGSLVLLLTLSQRSGEQVGSSSLAAGAEGWLVARRYLEAQGTETLLWDRAPAADMATGTFVLTFPALTTAADEGEVLRSWVERGGRLILGLSGSFPGPEELTTLSSFGLLGARPGGAGSVQTRPSSGKRDRTEVLDRAAASGWGPFLLPYRIQSQPSSWLPAIPGDAEVLYRRPRDGAGVVFRQTLGRGELLVMPASLMANGHLLAEGNADWLEALRLASSGPWLFDELHHGLVAAGTPERPAGSSAGFDLFGIHALVLYALGLWALARRFGPTWREAPSAAGSVAQFLRGLGRLHHGLGHHGEAARLLVARSRELDPRLELPEDAALAAERAEHPRDLMAVAAAVARARRR